MVLSILIAAAVGYLLGNLNGAVLISRTAEHDDVRSHGSGNAGFTNFFRSYGGFNSLIVIALDGLKAAAACLIGRFLLARYGLSAEGAALGAVAVALGHDFPAFLGFRGGKGIVCGFASACVLDWKIALVLLGVFAAFYFTTKFVSLCSCMCALFLAILYTIFHADHPWACAGVLFICALALFMHRENIVRLVKGKERKTEFFGKKEK